MANLPAAKKPIRRLSGDQNGSNAPSVPLICWAFDADSARTQSLSFPSGPKATKASRVPSGETEKLLCSKYQLDGGRIDERVGRIDCWPSPAAWRVYILQPRNNESTHVAANAAHQRIGTPGPCEALVWFRGQEANLSRRFSRQALQNEIHVSGSSRCNVEFRRRHSAPGAAF